MIRINLLGQARPKATRRPVPVEKTLSVVFFLVAIAGAGLFLFIHWRQLDEDYRNTQAKVTSLKSQKANLENLKAQVESFDRQKAVLQQRITVIEELQRNRAGGQELLDALAMTVTRTDALWLTSLSRKGNTLTIEGTGASINSVANFITQLKRSGYFQNIEIKESRQDERNTAVQTFVFSLNADFAPPHSKAAITTPAVMPVRKG